MSRHRNVRHLMDADYEDYYYDNNDDEYDDYDDGYSGGTSTMIQTKKKKKKGKAKVITTTPTSPAVVATTTAIMQNSTARQPPKNPKDGCAAAVNKTAGSRTPAAATNKTQQTTAAAGADTPTVASVSSETIQSLTIRTTNQDGIPPLQAAGYIAATEHPSPPPPIELTANQAGTKPLLTVVILGHVDAGKSTVTGHLLHLLQKNTTTTTSSSAAAAPPTASSTSRSNSNSSTIRQQHYGGSSSTPNHRKQHHPTTTNNNNNNNNHPNFAWLLDEDEQERIHGVTMDIATKQLELPNNLNLVILDAPGHADFVPAMITGAAAADAAVLTVDVTDSQTLQKGGTLKEHVYLAKGLGVNQILILLNKMDIVGFGNAELYHSIERQLREFLRTAGYPPHKVRCIPVSGLTGVNILRRSKDDNDSNNNALTEAERTLRQWYKGPTVVEALDEFDIPTQQSNKLLEKPLRLIVGDVVEGSNAISIRAKVVSGWVQQGEKLVLLPVGDTVSLTKIQSLHTGSNMTTTDPQYHQFHQHRTVFGSGEHLDASMIGLSHAQRISTGSLLVRSSQRPPLSSRCRARIFVLDISIPLIRGAQTIFHMHHLDIPCHLKALIRTLETDGSTVKKENPRALVKNTSAIVELQLSVPTCMEAFTDCRALGRFVLRRSGESVAVGRIEQVLF